MAAKTDRATTPYEDMVKFLSLAKEAKELVRKRSATDDRGPDVFDTAVRAVGKEMFVKALMERLDYTPPCRDRPATWVDDSLVMHGYDSLGLMTCLYLRCPKVVNRTGARFCLVERTTDGREVKFMSIGDVVGYLVKTYPETFHRK